MNNQFQPGYQPYGQGYGPMTNKRFVSGLDEAMSIRAGYNTEMVYFDSNYDVMYNIFTDAKGNKEYTVIDLSIRKPEKPMDINAEILRRLEELEKKIGGEYGKHNAQSPDTAASGSAQ